MPLTLLMGLFAISMCPYVNSQALSYSEPELFRCGFEEDETDCLMVSLDDDTFSWSVGSIPYDAVRSANASSGARCLFVEHDKLQPGLNKASMVTPPLGYTGRVCIRFFYYVRGDQRGSLSLVVIPLSNDTKVIWRREITPYEFSIWNVWQQAVVRHYIRHEDDAVALVAHVEKLSSAYLLVDEFSVKTGCCSPKDCNAEWMSWSSWQVCNSSCGAGVQQRRRHCDSPSDDKFCKGNDTETKQCPQLQLCKGDWGTWSSWTQCDATCGQGTRQREKICNSTSAEKTCPPGYAYVQMKTCSIAHRCSVAGWGTWSEWSVCGVTCGQGERYRERTCQKVDDESCVGNTTETNTCQFNKSCEVSGWGIWSEWSVCGVTCGQGERYRERTCQKVDDGSCVGNTTEAETCQSNNSCGATWQSWTSWGECSLACGEGSKIRTRHCSQPASGVSCLGDNAEIKECSALDCPATWGAWGAWSKCDDGCGVGVKSRERMCQYQHINIDCAGESRMGKLCTKDADCIATWGSWEKWGRCDRGCGKGFKHRKRVCNSPEYELTCPGNEMDEALCSVNVDCPAQWSSWGPWGECDSGCGIGFKHRQRFCKRSNQISHCIGGALEPKMCQIEDDCKKCPANCYKCDLDPNRCDFDYCMKGFYINNATGTCEGALTGAAIRTVVGAFTYLVPAVMVPIAVVVISATAMWLLIKRKQTNEEEEVPVQGRVSENTRPDVLAQSVHKLPYMHIRMDGGKPGEKLSQNSLEMGASLLVK